jgi:hypothetical protein
MTVRPAITEKFGDIALRDGAELVDRNLVFTLGASVVH